MKLSTLGTLVLSATGLTLGYLLGAGPSNGLEVEPVPTADLSGGTTHLRAPASVEPSRAAATALGGTAANATAAATPADLENIFPRSLTGQSLKEAVRLFGFRTRRGPEAQALETELRSLIRNPGEAFADVRDGLEKLPARYAAERQFLVQFASRLNVDAAKKVELLRSELQRPFDGSPMGAFSAPAALDSLYEATQDPALVEEALRDALRTQTDRGVQEILIARFSNINPESARGIQAEMGF